MAGNEVRVPFGDEDLAFAIPESWKVIGVCEPSPVDPCEDVDAETTAAIENPVGMPPLAEVVAGAKKIAVVVDDLSRPTPVYKFFDRVMDAVEAAGIKAEQISVVSALGVHRPMSDEAFVKKIGQRGFDRYRCINHNFEAEDLVHLGRTERGSEVWLNRTVAEADVVLSFGCIEPHTIAGFGGGYKNLFPGVAGKKTIAANHALNTTPATFNMVGSAPEENPMRCDLEECGRMVPGKVFIVNAVLDGSLRIVRIVAGDPVSAHREGIETSRRIFGVTIPKQGDVVIVSSHPFNNDLRQGFKALANTIRAVRKGGVMINLIRADEGLGDMNMPKRKLNAKKKTVRALCHVLPPLVGKLKFGLKEEDLYFVYFAMQTLKRVDVYFYSPNLPMEFSEKLPFLDMHKDLDVMLSKAFAAMPGEADVLVFPKAGVTYPILP